jgi:hypothetical protein
VALDERLSRELGRLGRPADPSGVYEELIRRRERRRVRRRFGISVLAIAVVLGTGVGFIALARIFDPGSDRVPIAGTGSTGATGHEIGPSGSSGRSTGRADVGIDFPLCDVTSIRGHFLDEGMQVAIVGTKSTNGSCAHDPGENTTGFVGLDVDGNGLIDGRESGSVVQCEGSCSAFVAADVDGNGTDELFVQNIESSIVGLQLFAVGDASSDGTVPLIVAPRVVPDYPETGLEVPQLRLGGDALELHSLRCVDDVPLPDGYGTARRMLVLTSATRSPSDAAGGVWKATSTWFLLQGATTIIVVDVQRFEEPVTDHAPSFAQDPELCGAAVPLPYAGD